MRSYKILKKIFNYMTQKKSSNLTEICNEINVTKPTGLTMLKELEQQGLISKVKTGRENQLVLTEKGINIIKSLSEIENSNGINFEVIR